MIKHQWGLEAWWARGWWAGLLPWAPGFWNIRLGVRAWDMGPGAWRPGYLAPGDAELACEAIIAGAQRATRMRGQRPAAQTNIFALVFS